MEVVVAGSHGLVGSALVPALEAAGHRVRRLVRGEAGPGQVAWDPAAGTIDAGALDGVEGVVNLAGVGIGDRRWTAKQKAAIRDSRVKGTGLLASTLAATGSARVLVNASAVGYYGDRGDEVLTEESTPGEGFLAGVVQEWEGATMAAAEAGVRVVPVRSGIVLSAAGGALKKQLPLFKLGLGGPLGSGRQWVSWITLEDEVGAIAHALTTDSLAGPVNATAPGPVTGTEFARALGRALHRPAVLPVPRAALSVVVGSEMTNDMATASQRAVPARLQANGYEFRHPDIDSALAAVTANGGRARSPAR